jgi:hypothetical protein
LRSPPFVGAIWPPEGVRSAVNLDHVRRDLSRGPLAHPADGQQPAWLLAAVDDDRPATVRGDERPIAVAEGRLPDLLAGRDAIALPGQNEPSWSIRPAPCGPTVRDLEALALGLAPLAGPDEPAAGRTGQ